MSRKFSFTDEADNNLTVYVSEQLDPSYGLYTWPSSVVLAQYLWHNRHSLLGKNILELGAGTSLPAIVSLMSGKAKSVTITDDSRQLKCLQNVADSCQLNDIHTVQHDIDGYCCRQANYYGTEVTIIGLSWGEVPPIFTDHVSNGLPVPDLILGSDCLFEESVFDRLLFSVCYLLKRSSTKYREPRFLCTYQVRSSKISLDYHLSLWGLQYKEIPLDQFCTDRYNIASSGMPGNHKVKLLEIRLGVEGELHSQYDEGRN